MKKIIVMIIMLSSNFLVAQIGYSYKPMGNNELTLFINNVGSLKTILSNGGGFWNRLGSDSVIVFDHGPWIIGKEKDKIKLSLVQWYQKYSSSFSPGPIIDGQSAILINPKDSLKYRAYKINIGDNDTNLDYKEWPLDLGAPVTQNGKPKFFGNQMIWTVYNALDNTNPYRLEWLQGSKAGKIEDTLYTMPIEVQQLSYVRKSTMKDEDLFSSLCVYEWTIINKGKEKIDSTFFSLWSDIDFQLKIGGLGYNIPAVDTSLQLGYCYARDSNGSPAAVGYVLLYGPMVKQNNSTSIFKGKQKSGSRNLTMSSFFAFFGGGAGFPFATPSLTNEAWNIARGFYTNGSKMIDPTTTKETKFTFNGDPVNNTGWVRNGYTGGGTGFNMFVGPFNMAANDTQWVMMALITALGKDRNESIKILRKKASLLRSMPYDSIAFGRGNVIVGVKEDEKIIPDEIHLHQNYPNPFNPATKIKFSIPSKMDVKLKVFDVLGREVAFLVNSVYEAGSYEVEFNGSNLPSGVYFSSLSAGTRTITKKMLLMK